MAGGDFSGPSAREIGAMLRGHAEAIGLLCLPGARRIGGFLCAGSLHGERGSKLKLRLTGDKAGTWTDYGTSDSDPKGKGDLLKLLQLTIGGGDLSKESFKRGLAEAKRFLALDSMDPQAVERVRRRAATAQAMAEREAAGEAERKRANAEGMWQAMPPPVPASPPFLYLAGRGIDFARLGRLPGAIRFHPGIGHDELGRKVPAMLTKFTALDGRHAATHVTYLDYRNGTWRKLPPIETIDPDTGEVVREDVAKKIFGPAWALRAHLPLWKGAERVPLKDVRTGTEVHVSEGIEDGLSYAMAAPQTRVIAAGTLGLIGQLELPPQAGDLVILAQNDAKPRPIEQLEHAVRAQQLAARAQGSQRLIRLRRPPPGIKDWNDWLNDKAPPPDGYLSAGTGETG